MPQLRRQIRRHRHPTRPAGARADGHTSGSAPHLADRARVLLVVLIVLVTHLVLPEMVGEANGQDRMPRPQGHVSDFAQVLAPQSRSQLEQILRNVRERLGVEVAVVTMRDLEGEDPTDYANRLYEEWGIGGRETDRGILILDVIGPPGRSFIRVEVGYGLEGILPDGRVGGILDRHMIPYLREGKRDVAYAAAIMALMRPVLEESGRDPEELERILTEGGYQTGEQPEVGREGLIALLPIIVIALILMRSRTGRGVLLGYMLFGGMMGGGRRGGGFRGGFGGGFGGFGGGLSGGGGAGRSY